MEGACQHTRFDFGKGKSHLLNLEAAQDLPVTERSSSERQCSVLRFSDDGKEMLTTADSCRVDLSAGVEFYLPSPEVLYDWYTRPNCIEVPEAGNAGGVTYLVRMIRRGASPQR